MIYFNKEKALLVGTGAWTLALAMLMTTQVFAQDLSAELPSLDQASETGLSLKETRVQNRLDQIIIQRKGNNDGEAGQGLTDYYDLNDTGQYDSGISERGLMRTWRFGAQ